MADRSRALVPLGTDSRGLAGPGHRADARRGRRRVRTAASSTSRQAPAARRIAAARRVGPEGAVLATDISGNILAFAARRALDEGLLERRDQSDGRRGSWTSQPGSFDAVISRVGFIYFPDQQAAFAGMRRALKPGGRLAGRRVLDTRGERLLLDPRVDHPPPCGSSPAPLPGQPGPFSLGAPGCDRGRLDRAPASPTSRCGASPRRCGCRRPRSACASSASRSERFTRCCSSLSESERADVWSEIEQELSQFETPDGFEGPCELIVSAGTAD